MKISNFRFIKEVKYEKYSHLDDVMVFATVEVTTGKWFWSKTEQKEIFKEGVSGNWKFMDSGKYTPGYLVEDLYSAYKAHKIGYSA